MDAQSIVQSYVDDVAARLPRRLRNDVGLELRTLLTDQLNAAVADTGRAPDHETAMEVLRQFGRPEEVAARYQPRGFQIIEPEHAPAFVTLSVACVVLQWAVTLPKVFMSDMTVGEWWMSRGFGAFAWVGALVLWFAAAGWVRRRDPVAPESLARPWTHHLFWLPLPEYWRPVDRDAVLRNASATLLPLSAVLIAFFFAPSRALDQLLPAGTDTSWALYGAGFQRWLLMPLIALMSARWLLFLAAVIKRRWWASTEGVRLAVWIAFIALLWWALLGWTIFAGPIANLAFKAWLLVFLIVNIQIVLTTRRRVTRVRVPKNLAG
jgi:hypothetical protein